jgi:diguanylate cyclase (GGDEF)-like protein/PAS domain S-box-containing protein
MENVHPSAPQIQGQLEEDASLSLPEGLVIRTIMNNSEDTIYFKNLASKFILNSRAHAIQFGEQDVRAMVGKDDFYYFPEEFARAAFEDEQKIIATGDPMIGLVEKWNKPDGTSVWFIASKYPLYDADGKIIGTWGNSRDITPLKAAEEQLRLVNAELQEANQKLEHLSIRDSLSGLYNHRHFFDSLNIAKSQESRQRDNNSSGAFSVLLLDVDRFKSINDTYGHPTGDTVIRKIGETLTSCMRMTDSCFRNGGDEFALILMVTELEAARLVAEKLRKQIVSSPIETDKGLLNLTVSIGVACSTEADTVEDLLKVADKRLYQSKGKGRNQVS